MLIRDAQATDGKLPAKPRPSQVGDWIKRARKLGSPPPIDDVPLFGSEWRDWYTSAMPQWRLDTAVGEDNWPLGRDIRPQETWDGIRQSGPNGLYMVVITLYWWSVAAETPDDVKGLNSALEDVEWVLTQLYNSDIIAAVRTTDAHLTSPSKVLTKPDRVRVVVKSPTKILIPSSSFTEKENVPPNSPAVLTRARKHAGTDSGLPTRSSKRQRK